MKNNAETDFVTVDFDLPFPIHISDKPLKIDVKGTNCELRFEKITRKEIDPRLRLGGGDFDLLEDRFGWVRYSKVNISMSLNELPPAPQNIKQDEWPVEIAIDAVNIFLSNYKDLMNAHWIRRMNPTEVWASDVVYFERGLPKRTVHHRRLQQLKPPITGINNKLECELRTKLSKGERASTWKLLLLDAEDAFSRGDTRLAVILGQTAIEGAISALLIRKFREKRPPLKEVRIQLKLKDPKKALSYEASIDQAGIDCKLSKGLNLAIGNDVSADTMLWYDWDIANATRVSCVHYGKSPSIKKARAALTTYWRIYQEYLEKPLLDEIHLTTDWAGDAINDISQALGASPYKHLSNLIKKTLPILKKGLVFYHIDRLPVAMDRNVNIMSEDRGDFLAIWLDPREDFSKNQIYIAGALVYFQIKHEGYPYAKVSDTLPLEPYRTGWELAAETLTQMVLRLLVNDRLRNMGFSINKLIEESFEKTKKQLLSPGYTAPQANEVSARTLPLKVMELYFGLSKRGHKQDLINLISKYASESLPHVECLLQAVQDIGYETRERCVHLMVRCRDCLTMLDSCLIVDPKKRLVYYSSGPESY